ncbi:tetratricopeptide repeat-containing sensor histidine kinase [Bacteroidales bacterium OttesenSCG-928-B11]|nr:tetratricopeptide repeat-containing sensor histidine kinase [Bacteroidales bacterium OttesenSCG-928-B11]MDL2326370.1 tetratricopeptide repeat-containing sensor histidine kinase [Bacteroidales bacterium OttesenSCG-928-A14]
MKYKHIIIICVGAVALSLTQAYSKEGKFAPQQQLVYYQKQIDSAQEERNVLKMASVYNDIVELCREAPDLKVALPENLYQYGLWSSYAGDHQRAIQALVELLEIPDKDDDKKLFGLKARANMQLGITYFFMERWDDALTHYQKAKEMAMELGDKQGLSIAENNIGNIYQKKGNYLLAIEQYQYSLHLQKEIDDKESLCNTYYNIGTCYRELGEKDASFPFFIQALEIAKEIGEVEIHALSLIELAHYNAIEKRQFYQADLQITEAETLAKETGYNQVLEEVYLIRSQIEEEKGNFANALGYYKKHKELSDTLFTLHSAEKLHEYEVRYQTKEKELKIEKQQAEIKQHKILQFIYIAGLMTAVLIVILLICIIRINRKRNRELKEIDATKDKFFSIISHDLKNPAIAQRNALQLLSENGNNWDAATLNQFHTELLKSADYQVELLYNLLNWAQVQTGRMPYRPFPFDFTESIRLEVAMIGKMAEKKSIQLDVQIPDQIVIDGDRNMLSTIIRNLLTNAIKFTNEQGKVSFGIVSSDKKHTISISDNGVGMSAEQLQNLFRIDKQQSKTGTAGEQGSGLGLIVSKELVEKHGSTLYVESEPGKGSRFWFEIMVS